MACDAAPASALLLLCAATAVPAAAPQPGQIDLALVHETARGRFGEPDGATTLQQTTLVWRRHDAWRGRAWSVELQWPWLTVRAPSPGAGLPDSAGRSTEARSAGQGDAWLIGRVALREADGPWPGLDLALKFKTAHGRLADGLGTGARDIAWQLEWQQPLGAPHQAFGHLGRRITGDLPGRRPYRDPWFVQLGWHVAAGSGLEGGAYVDLREPIGRLGALGELTGFVALQHAQRRWMLTLTHGWQPASPALSVGLGFRQRF